MSLKRTKTRPLALAGALAALALTLAALGPVLAAPKTPKYRGGTPKLVVEAVNDLPTWMVRVAVNHEDHAYKVGDGLTATVTSEREGYLYLFNVDVEGQAVCLFPNKYQSDNRIAAATPVTIPDPADKKYRIAIGAPTGTELLKAIVTKEPLKELTLAAINPKGGPTVLDAAKMKRVVLEPLGIDPMNLGSGDLQGEKEKQRQDNFKQYEQNAGGWAEHTIELITSEGKVEPKEKRLGLFIGINKFKDPGIRGLECSVNDATQAARVFQKYCGVTDPKLLTDEQATQANIQQAIRTHLVDGSRPGDTVFVYWSGHGGRCANVDGREDDAYDAYLVPHDGSLQSASEERRTMILDNTFGRWIQELDGRRVVVILDTCHSGGQVEGMKATSSPKLRKAYSKGIDSPWLNPKTRNQWTKRHFLSTEMARAKSIGAKNGTVLASSTFKQFSWERKEQDHSVMTYFLLEALKAESGLTAEQVAGAIKGKVKQYVDDNFEGSTQDIIFSAQEGRPVVLRP